MTKPNAIVELMADHIRTTLIAGGLTNGAAEKVALELVDLQLAALDAAGLTLTQKSELEELVAAAHRYREDLAACVESIAAFNPADWKPKT